MTTLTEFRANVKDVARNNRFLLSLFGPITNVISLPENYQFLVTRKTSLYKVQPTNL